MRRPWSLAAEHGDRLPTSKFLHRFSHSCCKSQICFLSDYRLTGGPARHACATIAKAASLPDISRRSAAGTLRALLFQRNWVPHPGRARGTVKATAGGKELSTRPEPSIVHRSLGQDFPPDVWQNAVVLIDKLPGWTSFDVCGKLRGIIKTRKVGHAGTLDPGATGLLIICTGKGTKHVERFMAQEKEYTGVMRLGEGTLSFDGDLEVTQRKPWNHITDQDLLQIRQDCLGDSMQLPPMFSAIKVRGERLYKAARRGEEVERPLRPIHISELELIRSVADPQNVEFRVACSKGTYIRALVHDMGKALGTVAYMASLRRTKIGMQSVENAWALEDLEQAVKASRAAH